MHAKGRPGRAGRTLLPARVPHQLPAAPGQPPAARCSRGAWIPGERNGQVPSSTAHSPQGEVAVPPTPVWAPLCTCPLPAAATGQGRGSGQARCPPLSAPAYTYMKKQWAAVSTHWASMIVPPQMWTGPYWRLACQGHLFTGASVPPTIRLDVLCPQPGGKQLAEPSQGLSTLAQGPRRGCICPKRLRGSLVSQPKNWIWLMCMAQGHRDSQVQACCT